MSKVAYISHPKYLLHHTGPNHPESADRLRAIDQRLKKTGLLEQLVSVQARLAKPEEIALVHKMDYIKLVANSAELKGVYLDGDTYACPDSYQAALFAAGGLLTAVDRVMDQQEHRAFAMVRPPGHHAEADYAMGFCLFNNVAVAAEYLIQKYPLKKVAIVDFDVHHGNATQHMFYDRQDIFYLSTHRYPFYPGTGALNETGSGAGAGYTLNLPMEVGCGDQAYQKIFLSHLLPALRKYDPDFLLVSAGFDAHQSDPLGGMNVSSVGFAWMVEQLEKVAQDCCQGKIVYTLEGGYDLTGLAESVQCVMEILLKQ